MNGVIIPKAFMGHYHIIALAISILLSSCAPSVGTSKSTPAIPLPMSKPAATQKISSTLVPTSTLNALSEIRWNIYSPDPQHLWNRLFRQFYRRTTKDGQEYGSDSLDPLLWPETTYLLEGTSYQQTLSVLDEFLSTKGENLITDPLRRAIFQHDMWAVFDWLTTHYDGYSTQRQELQWRLAQVIQKVALTDEEILSLPNNYESAVKPKTFPTNYQSDNPTIGFLPPDLLQPDGEWVCVGREDGPIAMTHTEAIPFYGRSAFLIFMRIPGGRQAKLKFLQELNSNHPPTLPPDGTEVALVRRVLLIDKEGEIVLSPLVASIQLRHFKTSLAQFFYGFRVSRPLLFAGMVGGIQPVEKEIMLFQSHGDGFQSGFLEEAKVPNLCDGCHIDDGQGINGINSILSYSRKRFPLPNDRRPILVETTPDLEAQAVINWKQKHSTWQVLETLWHEGTP